MPKKSSQDLSKHTLNLVKGDFQKLVDMYPDMGAAIVIRAIVNNYVRKAEGASRPPKVNVEIKL